MSLTVTLNGRTSSLENNFFPPINLAGEWEIGVLNLETFHSIPNVTSASYQVKDREPIKLPTGSYELVDIEKYINQNHDSEIIQLRGNRNTLKTEIFCLEEIAFSKELCELFGFKNKRRFEKGILHTSDRPTNIFKVNVIRIHCNIAQGSYLNGKSTHSIHEFFPTVAPGYKIIEVPNTVVYHSINTPQLVILRVDICDQDENLIDFRKENITVRLHLRRRPR